MHFDPLNFLSTLVEDFFCPAVFIFILLEFMDSKKTASGNHPPCISSFHILKSVVGHGREEKGGGHL